MDVNGTGFHLVLGREDWLGTSPAPDGLAWNGADHTLRLAPVPFVFPERTGNRRVGPGDRRGAAPDRYGNWFWIGHDRHEVRLQTAGTRGSVRYWPREQPCTPGPPEAVPAQGAGDFAPLPGPVPARRRLSGLAVTDDHRLLVGVPDLPGLLVFDLHAGGPPETIRWPAPLGTLDLAAAPGGGAWLLDTTRRVLWRVTRALAVADLAEAGPEPARAPDFVPAAAPTPTHLVRPERGSPVPVPAGEPVAVEALPDGTTLLLDRGGSGDAALLHLDVSGAELRRWPLAPLVEPLDVAFVPAAADGPTGSVLVVEDQGDQAFALDLDDAALTPTTRYLPLRMFTGKALVAGRGGVFYDMDEQWLPVTDRRAPRYRQAGTVRLGPFDGHEPGTVWHRLAVDAAVPRGTSVMLSSRAADDLAALAVAPWQPEPAPYLRHRASEVPYHRFGPAGSAEAGTWELLVQRAVGRHLEVRVELAGDGRHTPRLWALRAHAPRFSYLRTYLPDVYGEDAVAADFLDRYLAVTEGLLTTHEGEVAGAQVLLDPTTLDAEHLAWLARWVGASLDPVWDEARARLLVQHAVALFGRRGTVRGLVEAVRLATDECPDSTIFDGTQRAGHRLRVVEEFRTRTLPPAAPPAEAVSGPRVVTPGPRWRVADGRAELDRRWTAFVTARLPDAAAVSAAWGRPVATAPGGALAEPFRPLTPAATAEAALRREFVSTELAMPYADVGVGDVEAWRTFLAQRRRVRAATPGPGVTASSGDVALPTTRVPPDGTALTDWVDFVSRHLPTVRAAHRFTVLVPVPLDSSDAERSDAVARVARVVETERPAHTAYEVRAVWAAFQLGAARLGLETVLAGGSRFAALALGSGRLARGHLAGRPPWDAADRWVVGRDRVTRAGRTGQPQWRTEAGR